MKREEELTYIKVLYKCMNCENLFEDLRLGGGSMSFAPVSLICKNCNYQSAVDVTYPEDEKIMDSITKDIDNDEYYGKFKNKGGINPGYVEFWRRFCETCDPCPKCGGEFTILIKHKCPKCFSEDLRDVQELGGIKIKAPWVTHNKMKIKQTGRKC